MNKIIVPIMDKFLKKIVIIYLIDQGRNLKIFRVIIRRQKLRKIIIQILFILMDPLVSF